MAKPLNKSRKRLIIVFSVLFAGIIVMCFRVGWIQIVKGDEYASMAEVNHTKDTEIEAKRGTIFDRNGTKLAISAPCYSIWIRPADIKQGTTEKEQRQSQNKVIDALSIALREDSGEMRSYVCSDKTLVKVAKYKSKNQIEKLRRRIKKDNLSGIEIENDYRRYYPNGSFASHVLGSVTDDNEGRTGIELQYDSELKGISGRSVKDTAADGKQLSYGKEKYYEASDGMGVQLTIDEVIQHYAEKNIKQSMKDMKAKSVSCIMMDPKTGDIIAMCSYPEFNPNDAMGLENKAVSKALSGLTEKQKTKYWNDSWRNPNINDTYEPGSTFKLLTLGSSLEEGVATLSSRFYCSGALSVQGTTIKCWRYYDPHGSQSLMEATGNSCNPAFMTLALRLGKNRFYSHLDTFGMTERTGVDYPGEAEPIVYNKRAASQIDLASMGFGQSINVTRMQMVTAVSAYANGGMMMKPRLVRAYTDSEGKIIKKIEPKKKRQVVSKETAREVLKIMEFAVDKSEAAPAAVKGYRVGGKTGTAEKTINGKISQQTYSSFIGIAPINDPKFCILVVVDSPAGGVHGAAAAAPYAQKIMKSTLQYMDIQPSYLKNR